MSIKIIKPGICSTVQDMGRTGYRSLGIGTGGVMDYFAVLAANYLAGNNEQTPVIEMHFPAAEIFFTTDALICIAGANFDAHVNNEPVQMHQPCLIKKDSTLSFKKCINGARAYLAIHGGMVVDSWLGSYSTHLKTAAGGFKGRMLQKEDVITINNTGIEMSNKKITLSPKVINTVYDNLATLRCIAGPEWNLINVASANNFLQATFAITNQSDRMGYRLKGENLYLNNPEELISSPVSFGTIQLLPNGQLIILMADHQTTGGYPRVANIITTDLPKLAQLPVNNTINFKLVSVNEAEDMLILMHQKLDEIKTGCQKFYAVH
jgi:antagonist of KipI